MSENTSNIEQFGENAALSLVEFIVPPADPGDYVPAEVYRIFSYLARTFRELRTAIEVLRASLWDLEDRGHLMTDYRGEPLDEAIERFSDL